METRGSLLKGGKGGMGGDGTKLQAPLGQKKSLNEGQLWEKSGMGKKGGSEQSPGFGWEKGGRQEVKIPRKKKKG